MREAIVRVFAVVTGPEDVAVLESAVLPHGIELFAMRQGPTMVDAIANYQPDVVLIDVRPPGPCGFELCGQVRRSATSRLVPVIVVGTLDAAEARRRALEVDADDYFEKPVQRHLLAFRIRTLARLRRAWAAEATVR
jgi:PleD family two-component response regulator